MNDLNFFKKINMQKKIEKGVFILRHAEKSQVSNEINGINIPLTDHGKEEAVRLGNTLQELSCNLRLIKTSPFRRCVETSEAILRGLKYPCEIVYSNNLGHPGPFVIDDEIAGKNFSNNSALDVVRRQLKGEILPGMRVVHDGVNILLNEILKDLDTNDGFGIYVTHDAIVAPFVGYLSEIPITRENWIDCLEGVFLYRENGNISLIWNGRNFHLKNNFTAPSRGRGPEKDE